MTLTEEASVLIDRTETRRLSAAARLDDRTRVKLGQFFTPAPVADFIAALPHLPERATLRVLDPGAGIGSLTASLVARVLRERPELGLPQGGGRERDQLAAKRRESNLRSGGDEPAIPEDQLGRT